MVFVFRSWPNNLWPGRNHLFIEEDTRGKRGRKTVCVTVCVCVSLQKMGAWAGVCVYTEQHLSSTIYYRLITFGIVCLSELTFGVCVSLVLKPKDCFQAKMWIKIGSFWARPIEISYPKSNWPNRKCRNVIFRYIKKLKELQVPMQLWCFVCVIWWAGHFRYFSYFFDNNKWFFAFFIKLIWLGVGFLIGLVEK